jgi:hypothetical protein
MMKALNVAGMLKEATKPWPCQVNGPDKCKVRTAVLKAVCDNYKVVSTLLECTCSSGGLDPLTINMDIRWRWVIIFTSWPLYPGEISSGLHWTEIWTFSRAGCIPSKENQHSLNYATEPEVYIEWLESSRSIWHNVFALTANKHSRTIVNSIIMMTGSFS